MNQRARGGARSTTTMSALLIAANLGCHANAQELKLAGTQNLEVMLSDTPQFTANQLSSPTPLAVPAGQTCAVVHGDAAEALDEQRVRLLRFQRARHRRRGWAGSTARRSSCARPCWKGSRPAVFTWIKAASDAPREGGGSRPITRDYVDVDWFRVTRR
jgi:hypothetical protein